MGPKHGETHKGHEELNLLRKFHIDAFEYSLDGSRWLEVTFNMKRACYQLSIDDNNQLIKLGVRILTLQLILQYLPDILWNEATSRVEPEQDPFFLAEQHMGFLSSP